MNNLKQALDDVSIGTPTAVRNLAVFPLLAAGRPAPGYMVLTDALRLGLAQVAEVSQHGQVPQLTFENKGEMPVLLLDGEQLVGCKQNRILNLTILVPGHAKILIPVSCVEQGRWSFESSHFSASERPMFAELRAAKVAQVSRSLEVRSCAASDQSAIWQGITAKAARMGSDSASGAMSGIYRQRETDVDEYVAGLQTVPDQVGAMFAINGRVVGLELFDAPASYDKYFKQITSGYALDAVDRLEKESPTARVADAEAFVSRLAAATVRRFKSVGLGEDVRLEGDRLAGSYLDVSGAVVHLCAFDLGSRAPAEVTGQFGYARSELRPIRRGSKASK